AVMSEIFQVERDEFSNEIYVYSHGIVEENYRLSTAFLDASIDTINFTRLLNKQVTKVVKNDEVKENENEPSSTDIERIFRMKEVEKEILRQMIMENTNKIPIHQRVSKEEIMEIISEELKNRDMQTSFEFGVYGNGLETKVKSENFQNSSQGTYKIPLFADDDGNSDYE